VPHDKICVLLTFYICLRLHSEIVFQCLSEVVSHVRFLNDIHHILLVYQNTNTICVIRRRKSKNDRHYNIKHYTENWRLRTKRLTFEILVYSVIFCMVFLINLHALVNFYGWNVNEVFWWPKFTICTNICQGKFWWQFFTTIHHDLDWQVQVCHLCTREGFGS